MIRIKISATKVRNMCIEYGLYGAGDSAQYDAMLDYCYRVSNDVDTVDLTVIAKDIMEHSDQDALQEVLDGNVTIAAMANAIMYHACSMQYEYSFHMTDEYAVNTGIGKIKASKETLNTISLFVLEASKSYEMIHGMSALAGHAQEVHMELHDFLERVGFYKDAE